MSTCVAWSSKSSNFEIDSGVLRWRVRDEHAARCVVDNAIGRAASESMPGVGVAAMADDDQVEPARSGEL